MNETILVLGASGYLGRHLVAALADAGFRVRAAVRSRSRAEEPGRFGSPGLAGKVTDWAVGEITEDSFAAGLCDGVDRVASALGVTRQNADPWDVDFRANLRVLEDAERRGVRSFLYVNVMHAQAGRSTILRAKTAFAAALARSTVTSHIVNPSGYFSDVTDFLVMARRGLVLLPPNPTIEIAPIHGADLAEFCAEKLRDGRSGSWDVGGPEVLTYRQLADIAFDAAAKTPHTIAIPNGAMAAGVWLASHLGRHTRDLAQFFADGLTHDATGERHGTRRIAEYFREVSS